VVDLFGKKLLFCNNNQLFVIFSMLTSALILLCDLWWAGNENFRDLQGKNAEKRSTNG